MRAPAPAAQDSVSPEPQDCPPPCPCPGRLGWILRQAVFGGTGQGYRKSAFPSAQAWAAPRQPSRLVHWWSSIPGTLLTSPGLSSPQMPVQWPGRPDSAPAFQAGPPHPTSLDTRAPGDCRWSFALCFVEVFVGRIYLRARGVMGHGVRGQGAPAPGNLTSGQRV